MKFERESVATREEQRAVIRERVIGTAPEPMPYSRSGKRWRATAIVVTAERQRWGDDAWQAWRVMGIEVTGFNVKASGDDGAAYAVRRSDLPRDHWSESRAAAMVDDLATYGLDHVAGVIDG
jgi:hypothetical protein